MAETKDKTTAASGVQMQDAGVPTGQALAPRERQQKAAAGSLEAAHDDMLAYVEENRSQISRLLITTGVSFDLFEAALRTFLIRQKREQPEFFKGLNPESLLEALLRIARNGLLPDGKEAAIAVYKGVAQAMFMRDGFVKVIWRTGLAMEINDQVVTVDEYTTGRFEYEEGDQGFIVHKMDLMRKDEDPVAAAYCVIKLVGGGVMREVVPKDELDKIAKMSKSPARGAWKHQMHRKAALRRIMGKMPREAGIAQLLADDEDGYDKTALTRGAAPALTTEEMLSGRRARKPRPITPPEIKEPAEEASAEPANETGDDDGAGTAVTMLRGAQDVSGLMTAIHEIEEMLPAMDDEGRQWVAEEKVIAEKRIMGDGTLVEQGALFSPVDVQDSGAANVDAELGERTPTVKDNRGSLMAILSRQVGQTGFSDPGAWSAAILARMAELSDAALTSFWKVNLGFVLEAGENGVAQAEEIMDAAAKRGLPQVELD